LRFLAPFLGFLAGEVAMVIHLVARIKMGEGDIDSPRRHSGFALRASRNDEANRLSYPPSVRQ
jgi:hypothetical protein